MGADPAVARNALARVRKAALALPDATERPSHGTPSFFVRGRMFAMFWDHHHDDGHLGLWLAAPPGMQAARVAADPRRYYRPRYVGHRGWIGVDLDRGLPWERTLNDLEVAYLTVAPAELRERLAPTPPVPTAGTRRTSARARSRARR